MPQDSVVTTNRFPVKISGPKLSLSTEAFIDSGADDCLVDPDFAKSKGFTLLPLQQPLAVKALNGNITSE